MPLDSCVMQYVGYISTSWKQNLMFQGLLIDSNSDTSIPVFFKVTTNLSCSEKFILFVFWKITTRIICLSYIHYLIRSTIVSYIFDRCRDWLYRLLPETDRNIIQRIPQHGTLKINLTRDHVFIVLLLLISNPITFHYN